VSTAITVGYGGFVAISSSARINHGGASQRKDVPSAVVATGSISFAIIALGYYDPILVKHYFLPEDAGVYGVLSLAGRTVGIILSFVPIVLLPHVAHRTAAGRSSRAMLGAALAVSGAVSVAATVICALAAPVVVGILAGPAFGAAIPLLAMYVAAASCLAIGSVLGAYLIGKHDYRSVAPLFIAALGEVTAVIVRHKTMLEVVQDVLVGHAMVASVMLVAVFSRSIRHRSIAQVNVAT